MEAFYAENGSIAIGDTPQDFTGEVKDISVSETRDAEQITTFGTGLFLNRKRPDLVQADITFVAQSEDVLQKIGSPTPNDTRPREIVKFTWAEETSGSVLTISMASAICTDIGARADVDGALEYTGTWKCLSKHLTSTWVK